jgi:hypothetical protein
MVSNASTKRSLSESVEKVKTRYVIPNDLTRSLNRGCLGSPSTERSHGLGVLALWFSERVLSLKEDLLGGRFSMTTSRHVSRESRHLQELVLIPIPLSTTTNSLISVLSMEEEMATHTLIGRKYVAPQRL